MITEITICRQFAPDDSEYWQLRLTIGCQTFTVGEPSDDREHADWMAAQLRTALGNAGVTDIRVGEVASPFDRLPTASPELIAAIAADNGGQFNPLAHEGVR